MSNIISPVDSLQLLVDEQIAALPLTDYPMLNRLQKKAISQQFIKWTVDVGGASATGESVTADITTFSEELYVPAFLPIAGARVSSSFQLSIQDIAQAKSAGKGALRDLFASDVDSALRTIMQKLSTNIYVGDGTNAAGGIVGLQTAGAASGVYANIDPATYPLWVSYVNTNASNRALTSDLLYATDVAITRKGGRYTAIYCSPELAVKYKQLFAAQLNITTQLPAGQADLGYTGLAFSGRPIIQDINCPNNVLYFVDESEIYLYTLNHETSQNRGGIQVGIDLLTGHNNPNMKKYGVFTMPQLQLKNRAKAVAVLDKITQ